MAEPSSLDFLICTACGTQYEATKESGKKECEVCDDPRQFVPASGQAFTTLREVQAGPHKNTIAREDDPRIFSITTDPKIGIGQRAILIRTEHGNVLWDCISYIDDETVTEIEGLGGVKAMVISHPHFYTTHVEWARAFGCPLYTSIEDASWLQRRDAPGIERRFINGTTETILPGVTAVKTGGHFDGSLVLHYDASLFIADSLLTVQSGYNHHERKPGVTTYSFMWSIPNFIPLPPNKIEAIWEAVKPWHFTRTYGLKKGWNLHDAQLKKRVLASAKIQIRAEGYAEHRLLGEELS